MADTIGTFEGFPKQALQFLTDLAAHNDTKWFAANKHIYEEAILGPSRAFVVALGEQLRRVSKGIQFEPKVNGSLFRINRDTRFSADKTPYKTSVGIFLWEGTGKRMECPGFYFHLEPGELLLGTGIWMFPPPMLELYRESVVDATLGPALGKAVKAIGPEAFDKGGCGMEPERYKRVPPGYDPQHPRAELLKNKGLIAGIRAKPPREQHSAKLVDYCVERYRKLAPLHQWLLKMLAAPA